MTTVSKGKKKFKEKLKDTYRILVIDVEDLKEVGNYQFTMARLYTLVIGFLLIFSVLLVSMIAFTPLKRFMPGYGDIEENHKFIELRKKITALEMDLEDQIVYTQGLQNMLSGQEIENLNLPESNGKSGDNADENKSSIVLSDQEVNESKFTRSLNNLYFVSPILGSISAPFDRLKNHYGVDILAAKGTAIKSITSGVVISSDFTVETGNTLAIQHPNNLISIYKHNSALLKNIGDKVSAGEAVAIIGNTGELTDGPHLHFELWYNGNAINPENFINFQ
ncbi:MAG: M23 family metallopeptidase [Saprospiraceae bacterium]|nr:M23 family metallopeptidase [Saprospiraceae bacterium]